MNNEEKILAMLSDMKADLSEMKTDQEKMKADLSEMKATQEKMKADQEKMKADQEDMQTTLTRVAVTQENVVLPRIQALYESHGTIMEKLDTLAPKERVDEHESDISIMKDAITLLRMDVNELKKAQ